MPRRFEFDFLVESYPEEEIRWTVDCTYHEEPSGRLASLLGMEPFYSAELEVTSLTSDSEVIFSLSDFRDIYGDWAVENLIMKGIEIAEDEEEMLSDPNWNRYG